MKHRALLFMLALALVVGLLPGLAAAQESESGWDLTQDLKFNDLGLDIKYPTDWVYEATEKSGVFVGENKDDIALAADGDPATFPATPTLNVVAISAANLASVVGENAKLDQYVDFWVKSYGVTEADKRLEAPILGRRSITTYGEDAAKHGIIMTVWHQGDTVVGATLMLPALDAANDVMTWALWLKAIDPIDALPLSETPVELKTSNATVFAPEGWVRAEGSYLTYELQSDIDNSASEGAMFFTGEQSLSDLQLKDDATIEDAAKAIAANTGVTPTRQEDFILLGKPAIMYTGQDGTGKYVIATQAIVDGEVVQIALIAPTGDKFLSLVPTYLAVIKSLQTVKADG
jgi:hypothetical protein